MDGHVVFGLQDNINNQHERLKLKETNIQNLSLIAASSDPDVMLWRNQVGTFYTRTGQPVKIGSIGAADSLGVVRVLITPEMVGKYIGVAIAPEFKQLKGRQSEGQKLWQQNFERRGGKYVLIRSPGEMIKFIEDIKKGAG